MTAPLRWPVSLELLRSLRRTSVRYVVASIFQSASKYLLLSVMPFAVSPALFGEYNLAVVVANYALHLQLGLFNALPQHLPGLGPEPARARLAALRPVNGIVTALALLVIAVALAQGRPRLAAYVIIALYGIYFNFLYQARRGLGQFGELGKLKIWLGSAHILLSALVLALPYGRFLMVHAAAGLAVVLVLAREERATMVGGPAPWNPVALRDLLGIGFPIMVLGFLGSLQMSIDRVILGLYRPVEDVGLYSIGALLLAAVMLFPGSVLELHYARLARFWAEGDGEALRRQRALQFRQTMPMALTLAAAGMLVVPPLLRRFLPHYAGAVPSVYWLLAASVFLVLGANYSNVFTATRRAGVSIVNTIVTTGGAALTGAAILSRGAAPVHVAASTCAWAAIFAGLQHLALRRVDRG